MNPWLIGVLAWFAASLVVAGLASTFMRHATSTEDDDYWPPEHGQLIAQVVREIAGEVEHMERLANTGELQAIDIDLYDPDDFGHWEREVSQ